MGVAVGVAVGIGVGVAVGSIATGVAVGVGAVSEAHPTVAHVTKSSDGAQQSQFSAWCGRCHMLIISQMVGVGREGGKGAA